MTTPPPPDLKDRMVAYVKDLQARIADAYARADGTAEAEPTTWERPGGGGGTMRVLRGTRIEKAGVNVSVVHGNASPITGNPFFATGLSTIAHPANPHAPTVHMNVRYFQEDVADAPRWWFGGGMDLTPMGFPYDEDTTHFHRVCREAVDAVDPTVTDRYVQWADEYFHVKHRKRPRGVGGIFFDERTTDPEADFRLVQSVGDRFLDAYLPILERRKDQSFTQEDRETQLKARGVYVEFNLLYDRGTRFGFQSGGNPDAILVSLPPLVAW